MAALFYLVYSRFDLAVSAERVLAVAQQLLDAGADPNDAQTLYNRMFAPDDSHLRLLFGYGLGTGDGGPWKTWIHQMATAALLEPVTATPASGQ